MFVLDCSVAISWLMPDEKNSSNTLERLSKERAIVPSLWFLEVENV